MKSHWWVYGKRLVVLLAIFGVATGLFGMINNQQAQARCTGFDDGIEHCAEVDIGKVLVPAIVSCNVAYTITVAGYEYYYSDNVSGDCRDHLKSGSWRYGNAQSGDFDYVTCDVDGYSDSGTTCTITLNTGQTVTVGNNETFSIDLEEYPIVPHFVIDENEGNYLSSAMTCPDDMGRKCRAKIHRLSNDGGFLDETHLIEPGGGAIIGIKNETTDDFSTSTAYEMGDDGKDAVLEIYTAEQRLLEHDPARAAEGEQNGNPPSTTCESAGGTMGWLMCPLIDLLGNAVDLMMEQITGQLNYQSINGDKDETIRKAWGGFVSFANIAFAITFLIS
jgi:hypothetical protein